MIKSIIEQNQDIKPNSELLYTLKTALPQYFDADGNFKTDKFTAELKENNITEANDGYRLSFVGKDYARLQTGQASQTVIVPDHDHNTKPENANSQNVFITGDNLEALRHLQNAYASDGGKIKMIYIDPPYNTGKEFVYNDRFEFDDEKLKTALGYGDAEIERLKSIQGKSSHSAWLAFMYPRLKLAQKLLTDDGAIFVSIDENEQANLKLLMDDIFGEGNFVGSIIREVIRGGSKSAHVREVHDYVLVFARNKSELSFGGIEQDGLILDQEDIKGKFKKGRELNKWGAGSRREDAPGMWFPILGPNSEDVFPIRNDGTEGRWRLGRKKMLQRVADEDVIFEQREDGTYIVYEKLRNDSPRFKQFTTLFIEKYTNAKGTERIKEVFGIERSYFDYVKPTELIADLVLLMELSDEDTILDFFAGSGTTAHAIMQLNAEDEDSGNRKYIMVQWDEPTNPDSEARKVGYQTIDEISRERIKRAGAKIKAETDKDLDVGFKHYRLHEPAVQTIDKLFDFDPNESKLFADDMLAPFAFGNPSGLPTILQTWLIQDGYVFNTEVTTLKIADYQAQYVKQSAVLYLINNGFSHEALKDLLNKIGKHELVVNTLIVYPYSFTFEQMRELKNNIKSNLDQHVTIIERY